MDKTSTVNRRNFSGAALGVTVGGTGLAGAGLVAGPQRWFRAETAPPKRQDPLTPYKTGHMTFFTGPAAVLGEQSYKGHILAAEEINAQGGLLGKRQIETLKADEAAGTDANVKELRRMKLGEDRPVHRHHLERQHARPRSGRRGGEVPDDLRRRLHRLPVREGRARPALHLPADQHPVGGRRDGGDRGRHGVARGAEDRPHPSRLLVRAQRLRPLQRWR